MRRLVMPRLGNTTRTRLIPVRTATSTARTPETMVGAPRSTVKISRGTIRTWIAIFVLAVLCSSFFIAPFIAPVEADGQKPPQDSGIAGLQQELRKLQTTARLLHTVAHPDDEDGGMLALQSRGVGADVMLFTLNRGEGGQNKTGKELFDSLGVLRTL